MASGVCASRLPRKNLSPPAGQSKWKRATFMQTSLLADRKQSNLFDLAGRVAVITGGAGLLGEQHARVIAGAGGTPVLLDVAAERARSKAKEIAAEFDVP